MLESLDYRAFEPEKSAIPAFTGSGFFLNAAPSLTVTIA
jgi:hypothetical protein